LSCVVCGDMCVCVCGGVCGGGARAEQRGWAGAGTRGSGG
jgi:hypothetical protein